MLRRQDWFAPAKAVTETAGASDLVLSIDAKPLSGLLAAHGRDGAMSDKAGAHGVASVKNLAATALEILAAHYIRPGGTSAGRLRKIASVVIAREARQSRETPRLMLFWLWIALLRSQLTAWEVATPPNALLTFCGIYS